jgi:hypothetical protein
MKIAENKNYRTTECVAGTEEPESSLSCSFNIHRKNPRSRDVK